MLNPMNNLTIKAKLLLLVCILVTGFSVNSFFMDSLMNKIKITGPVYHTIISNKDLVADILPPPEYLIETFLTSLQMHDETDPQALEKLITKCGTLKKDYVERHEYWKKELPEGKLKAIMVEKSYEPAMELFDILEKEYIPAVKAQDAVKVDELIKGRLKDAYEEHRAAIDEAVKLTNIESSAIENSVQQKISWAKMCAIAFALVILGVVIALALIMIRSINRSVSQLSDTIKDIVRNKDLTRRVEIQGRDEIGKIGQGINEFLADLEEIISKVKETSAQVNSATQEVASGSQSLSQLAQEQAASVEEVAATFEEMTASIKQNASHADKGHEVTRGLVQRTNVTRESTEELMKAMDEISSSSKKIGDIIATVNEVAFQTNLLALNAAVEAARAGEHGKGFAVVAEEVRSLAQRSAEAAKQIKGMIEDSVNKVMAGDTIVKKSIDSLKEIIGNIDELSQIMEEISTSSTEQAVGIDEVNKAIAQIDSATQQNASTAEELATTAETLSNEAEELILTVRQFKAAEGS